MNASWLVIIGLAMMLSIGPWFDHFLLPRPRLDEDKHIIWMMIVWTFGMMLFILGITSLHYN